MDGWKFRMALGQTSGDRGDGTSEPSNSIHWGRLRGRR